MIDIDNLKMQLSQELERYQKEHKITDADVAWTLLQLGTNYYFKDISSRGVAGERKT